MGGRHHPTITVGWVGLTVMLLSRLPRGRGQPQATQPHPKGNATGWYGLPLKLSIGRWLFIQLSPDTAGAGLVTGAGASFQGKGSNILGCGAGCEV
jgi:hypothetical protein